MYKILFSLLLFSAVQTTYAGNSLVINNSREEMARNVVGKFKESKAQLLILAESGRDEEYTRFFVDMWDDTFDFIALEIQAQYQGAIDAYMSGKTDELNIKSTAEAQNIKKFVEQAREYNKSMAETFAMPPIQILAIDKPDEGYNSVAEWFSERDQFMFDRIKPLIEAGKRGLLYLGGAHLTKHPLPTPRVVRKFMKMPDIMENLGSKIENAFPNRSFRVWLDAEVPPTIAFAYMPPDMAFLTTIDLSLRSSLDLTREKIFMISTDDERFLKSEVGSRPKKSIPMFISKEFGYYVSLARPKQRGPGICASLLSKGGWNILFRGLMMRLF